MTTLSHLVPLGIAGAAVLGLVVAIARFKMNAFVALLLASLFVGVASRANLQEVLQAMAAGLGGVLGSVAVVIGLGAIIGQLLATSGGAEVVAQAFLRTFGAARVHWAMMCVGLVVGIAVWFTVGLVLLIPIAWTLARKTPSRSLLVPGIPMLAGLSVMHGLAPPHPGPMAAIGLLGADTGKTILYSLLLGVPLAIVAGPVLVKWVANRVPVCASGEVAENGGHKSVSAPSLPLTLFTIALPVLLMLGATAVEVAAAQWRPTGAAADMSGLAPLGALGRGLVAGQPWIAFVGSPIVAMLVGLLFAMYSFGIARGFDRTALAKNTEASLAPVAMVLLVVGAGGAFSKVLNLCGVGDSVTQLASGWQLSPLLLGWIMAALIRVAVGSATVAISTAAGMVAPMAAGQPEANVELLVLAMGAGSLILSHVNDGGFWFVKEYFGMTVPQTFKTWTVLETILAVAALPLLLILDHLI